MPVLRPFHGLRYDLARIGDLNRVLCPPYDVITADDRRALLARDPHNAVRLESPFAAAGGYVSAARTLAEWCGDGILVRDQLPSFYIHEMRYLTPAGEDRSARGVICRLELEPLGAAGGVRPHERTMEGPKEDRFRLLVATGANLSPVVLIDGRAATSRILDRLSQTPAAAETTDQAGITHRLWVVPTGSASDDADGLLETVGEGPLTIADGHHRYETALRYRHECAAARKMAGLPPADTVMALVYSREEAPSVLATHRVVRHLPGDLVARAARFFHVRPVDDAASLLRLMSAPDGAMGSRIACWTPGAGAILGGRSAPDGVDAVLLARALRELVGIDEDEMRAGGRVIYTKDPAEAIALVESGDGDAAFILDPTPLEVVLRVAARGGIMPQKSTYFQPKAPTGLVFDALDH